MPTPKLFKKFSSKKDASESSPAPDEPANGEKDDVPQTVAVTVDSPVPGYSDSLKEAWTVAHQELPLAQGAEKILNKIGMSLPSSIRIPTPRRSSMRIFHSALTYNGKRMPRTV
jgi:hypothetical protein